MNNAKLVPATRAARILSLTTTMHPLLVLLELTPVMHQREVSTCLPGHLLNLNPLMPVDMAPLKLKGEVGALQVNITMSRREV